MSNFRIVKERKQIEVPVDGDLRGLSNFGILEVEHPWVYLAAKNISREVTELVQNTIGLEVKFLPKENITLFYDKSRTRNHKVKAVRLAGAAYQISVHNNSTSMMMAQLDTLKYKILNIELEGNVEAKTDEFTKWNTSLSGLQVYHPLTTYLSQAGFKIAENSELTHLNASEIKNFAKTTSEKLKNKTSA